MPKRQQYKVYQISNRAKKGLGFETSNSMSGLVYDGKKVSLATPSRDRRGKVTGVDYLKAIFSRK